jgi:hypothetical protein
VYLNRGIQHLPQPAAPVFPLKKATGAWYPVDQMNRPFHMRCDTGWAGITTISTTDWTTYLNDRLARGFNTLFLGCMDNQYNWGNTVNAGTWGANVNGDFPFTTVQGGGTYNNAQTQSPDFTTTKAAYWNFAKTQVQTAANLGFLVLLYPIWIGSHLTDPSNEGYYNALVATSSGNRQAFGAFIANTFGGIANVLYVIGGDNDQTNAPSAATNITNICNDIRTGIQSVSGQLASSLLSFDGSNGNSPLTVWGGTGTGNSWIWPNNVYTDELNSFPWVYQNCKTEYQRSDYPNIAYYFKEGSFENENSATAQFLRSQTWQAGLGGAFGYTFGEHSIWQFASGWQTKLAARGSLDMQVANRFFSPRAWWKLVPDWGNAFLTNGGSYTLANFASAALASDNSWAAIYVPVTENLTVATSSVVSGAHWYWLDVTNGATQDLGTFSGSHTFSPPNNAQGDHDMVLYAEVPGRSVWV